MEIAEEYGFLYQIGLDRKQNRYVLPNLCCFLCFFRIFFYQIDLFRIKKLTILSMSFQLSVKMMPNEPRWPNFVSHG